MEVTIGTADSAISTTHVDRFFLFQKYSSHGNIFSLKKNIYSGINSRPLRLFMNRVSKY